MKELRIPSTDPIHGQGLKDEGGPLCRCQACLLRGQLYFFSDSMAVNTNCLGTVVLEQKTCI